PAIQSDPTIRTLIEKKNQAEADMQTLLKQYREKHPVVIKARANLKFLDESIETEKRRIIENLKTKAEGQLSVQQGRILEAAEPPERPVGPDRMRIVLLVTLGVLIANLVVLFLTDYFDDTIHVMEDLERKGILVPFLGPLPLIREKETGRKPVQLATKLSESAKVEILEAFRYLRVAINFSAPPEALKLLAITSCLPAEGKSFMSLNVAASLAMDGNKTLLVDADLRRPTIHESFDVENDTGLSNYLTGNVDFNAMVKESYIENLSLFTSGPTSPNPSEILGSDRMKLFLQDAVKVFDRVIIDCPPLTGIGDGFVIGSLIGHLILVVSAGKTPSDLIRHTQQQLDKMGIKLLGMVLNKMDVEKERYGGYTKHYYRTYNKYYRSNK
ncbi:MAG: polysaccharide biosynthesis tyrosine autokinase, partial [Candidatus Omnitrophica bacterium]|nr:polysaccharide biosynthesis tyrosine autokinase [Candidatus Omnitrophota bacterium]